MKRILSLLLLTALLLGVALCLGSCGDSPNPNFNWLIIPFAALMRVFSRWFSGNYVWALLLFAILMKVIFLPFSVKQQKNQIKGAKLRPQMSIIEKKYAGRNDQDSLMKKRQELMDMQQREGYSPASGCLPLLIQMIVVIVLYGIVRSPLTYLAQMPNETVADVYSVAVSVDEKYKSLKDDLVDKETYSWNEIKGIDQFKLIDAITDHREDFTGVITDEERDKIPNLSLGKLDLADVPSFKAKGVALLLLLVPFLNLALAIVTMKIQKKYTGNLQAELSGQNTDDPGQKVSNAMMEWMMPLMSFFFCFMFQAILGVYWIFQSVFGLIQMVILNKLMPMPTFTEEEIRAYKKALNERPASNSDPNRPRPRSLHHIDDDDDDVPAREVPAGRDPNTSKKKAQQQDEREHRAEREAARQIREQKKQQSSDEQPDPETPEEDTPSENSDKE